MSKQGYGFYGVTGSAFGCYEALAKGTGKVPTLTTLQTRHPMLRLAAIAWALGLAAHFHKADRDA